MAKKWYGHKGWFIPNTCIFLQQGNGLASGSQHNYQWSGPIGHFGVKWWRRKWGAKDNIPEDTMMDLEEKYKTTKLATLRSKMGSNNVNNAPREYGSIQSIQQREGSSNWYSKEVQPRRLDQLWKTPVDLID